MRNSPSAHNSPSVKISGIFESLDCSVETYLCLSTISDNMESALVSVTQADDSTCLVEPAPEGANSRVNRRYKHRPTNCWGKRNGKVLVRKSHNSKTTATQNYNSAETHSIALKQALSPRKVSRKIRQMLKMKYNIDLTDSNNNETPISDGTPISVENAIEASDKSNGTIGETRVLPEPKTPLQPVQAAPPGGPFGMVVAPVQHRELDAPPQQCAHASNSRQSVNKTSLNSRIAKDRKPTISLPYIFEQLEDFERLERNVRYNIIRVQPIVEQPLFIMAVFIVISLMLLSYTLVPAVLFGISASLFLSLLITVKMIELPFDIRAPPKNYRLPFMARTLRVAMTLAVVFEQTTRHLYNVYDIYVWKDPTLSLQCVLASFLLGVLSIYVSLPVLFVFVGSVACFYLFRHHVILKDMRRILENAAEFLAQVEDDLKSASAALE